MDAGSSASGVEPQLHPSDEAAPHSSSSAVSSVGASAASNFTPASGSLDGGQCVKDYVSSVNADDQPGTSGTRSSVDWDKVKTAQTALQTARAALKVDPVDYDKIIDTLDQICVILKKELGDLHVDTIDALYEYGVVLLDYYQLGSSLVSSKATNVVRQYAADLVAATDEPRTDGVPDDGPIVDENDDPDESQDDEDSGNSEGDQSDLESLPGGGPLDNSNNVENMAVVEQPESPNEAGSSSGHAETSGNADRFDLDQAQAEPEEEDAVAIAELRYAWEILEIARVGYEKRVKEGATRSEKLRLSEIHHKLSLCAAENGQENLAMVEGERALKICEQACQPTDRELAEAYFNYGSLCSMYSVLTDAAENMKTAVSILESHKVLCEVKLKNLEVTPDENALEIDDLKRDKTEIDELIPDLMKRIQDTYEDMRLGSDEAKRMLDDWLKGVSDKCHVDAGMPIAATQPVNDISHLVRRVKRPGDVVEDETTKRLKGCDGEASSSHTSGSGVNGKAAGRDTAEAPVTSG